MTKIAAGSRTLNNRAGHRRFIGYHYSWRTDTHLGWEGFGERALQELLDLEPDVVALIPQPRPIRVCVNGVMRRYTADLEVIREGGQVEVNEVKSEYALEREDVRDKLDAARKHYAELGCPFFVHVSGELTRSSQFENARLLRRYARDAPEPSVCETIFAVIRKCGPITLAALTRVLRRYGVGRAPLFWALYHRHVEFDWATVLNEHTPIWAA